MSSPDAAALPAGTTAPMHGARRLSPGSLRRLVPSLSSWRGALIAPASPRTYLAVAHLGLSAVVGFVIPAAAMTAILLNLYEVVSRGGFGLSIAATVAYLVLLAGLVTASLALVPRLSRALRWFAGQFDGSAIPGQRYRELPRGPIRRLAALWRDKDRWIDLGRICLTGLAAAAGWFVTAVVATLSLRFFALPLAYARRRNAMADIALEPSQHFGFTSPWFNVLAGIVIGYLACFLVQLLASALQLAGHRLLAPLKGRELAERVVQLQRTRSDVVDAADRERQRIERDLHDGAQQRLVALSVDLGLARRQVEADPTAAPDALEHAQREVEASLAELRALVRGIFPQVLTDRGLHEAAEALVTRSAVPASLCSPGPAALAGIPAPIAAGAYFVISECLTNVASHGRARSALVVIERDPGELRVTVSDDGAGGASMRPGGGLDGLRRRVAALDGSLVLTSPVGSGTSVKAVFPCAS